MSSSICSSSTVPDPSMSILVREQLIQILECVFVYVRVAQAADKCTGPGCGAAGAEASLAAISEGGECYASTEDPKNTVKDQLYSEDISGKVR